MLNTPEQAVKRVERRVSMGGHNIPVDVIHRRYEAGLQNLFQLYMPVCNYWALYDNSDCPAVKLASGCGEKNIEVLVPQRFQELQQKYGQSEEEQQP